MIELKFLASNGEEDMNDSIEIGDKVYYINNPTNYASSGFTTSDGDDGESNMILIGTVCGFASTSDSFTIYAEQPENTTFETLGNGDFIFFSKDNVVNTSSVVGYYNEVIFENSSPEPAELFAVSCDISESSK